MNKTLSWKTFNFQRKSLILFRKCYKSFFYIFFFCLFPCLYFINVASYGKKLFLFKSFFFTDKINLCFVTKLNSFYWAFFFCGDDDDDDCTACFFFFSGCYYCCSCYICMYMGESNVWLENVFPINKFKKLCLLNKTWNFVELEIFFDVNWVKIEIWK